MHTNSTTNYNLPQFLATDKPAWLTDVNPAYTAIDTGMHNAQAAADAAQGDATQALSNAASAQSSATSADAKASGAIASLAKNFLDTSTYTVGEIVIYNNIMYKCIADVNTPGPWTGTTNWSRYTVDALATEVNNVTSEVDDLSAANLPMSATDPSTIKSVIDGMQLTVKNYTIDLGTEAWYGVYWGDLDINNDFIQYGSAISAVVTQVFDELGTTRVNRPTFAQLMTVGAGTLHVRAYSPTASMSAGYKVNVRVVFAHVNIL